MLFGDHFFSHTLVSMLLSLTITCALASVFFKRMTMGRAKNKVFNDGNAYKTPVLPKAITLSKTDLSS